MQKILTTCRTVWATSFSIYSWKTTNSNYNLVYFVIQILKDFLIVDFSVPKNSERFCIIFIYIGSCIYQVPKSEAYSRFTHSNYLPLRILQLTYIMFIPHNTITVAILLSCNQIQVYFQGNLWARSFFFFF